MNATANTGALLEAAGIPVPEGFRLPAVGALRTDSRSVAAGDAFLALRGAKLDGTAFAAEAARRGAALLLVEADGDAVGSGSLEGAPALFVPGLRRCVGPLFDAWHGFPSRRLRFHGVTGTNGKSTSVLLMSAILKAAGRRVVTLGTIRYQIGDEVLDAPLTTPSTESFYDLIARGAASGCDAVAMEVSSHALQQDRVRGVTFQRAVFTNLTQDHLDFHPDFEDYFAAKKRLFTEYLAPEGVGIVNLDSPYGLRLLNEWNGPRFAFSRHPGTAGADLVVREKHLSLQGTRLILDHAGKTFPLRSPLIGDLNVENLLAAAAFGLSLGLAPELVAAAVAGVTVPGRNEVFPLEKTPGAFAVVDYAHTPDALERVLESLRPLTPGRLHVVFGCGGDRDRGKRPLMGGIADRLADRVILTSDNPRTEDPSAILDDVRKGMARPDEAVLIPDRRAAIRRGLEGLEAGDCLLVAGKGHEDYQILGTERIRFSDQEEIAAWN